jgi:hypothetical protein
MIQPLSPPQRMPLNVMLVRRAVPVIGIVVGLAVLLGATALWARYGTAVFFEMIVSGLEACF